MDSETFWQLSLQLQQFHVQRNILFRCSSTRPITKRVISYCNLAEDSGVGIDLDQIALKKLSWIKLLRQA